MYRQQQSLPGGRGYVTEVAGRDRVKFFRRPVEPDNTVLDGALAATSPAQLSASCPSFTMPSNAAVLAAASSVPPGRRASRIAGGVAAASSAGTRPRRPSSATQRHPHSSHSASASQGLLRLGRRTQQRDARPPHHLPSLHASGSGDDAQQARRDGRSTAGVQTLLRDNEAQTDPYSPDYYIPAGAATPEILSLQGLTYQNGGLPAGGEEVLLIQRLRRRRDVEAALPSGSDAASVEARYTVLHELEEKEWAEREEHAGQLQQRRLDRLQESLMAREAARETVNRKRLETIKEQYLHTLGGKLTSLEKRRVAASKLGIDKMAELQAQSGRGGGGEAARGSGALLLSGSQRSRGTFSVRGGGSSGTHGTGPSIAAYARYGVDAAPPSPLDGAAASMAARSGTVGTGVGLDAQLRHARQAFNYDVRPQLLTDVEGAQLVDTHRGGRVDRVDAQTFVVPENDAVQRLPTLYQRREAERVLQSLAYAHNKLHPMETESDTAASGEVSARQVLELYRATPKLQRPATPVLELDGDEEEEEEDACILLQRLLRGRAVQNDFFEGRERCRGLIEELQAASNAHTAGIRAAAEQQQESDAAAREADAQSVLNNALGVIVHDTLGFLSQELGRQQDMAELRAMREEAEAVRQTREAAERARRAEVRQRRDRNEVAYAAYMRATDTTVQCFLEDMLGAAVEDTALAVAVREEESRQAARPSPRQPATAAEAEEVVCDVLDSFLIPTVVEAIQLRHSDLEKRAVGAAALDLAHAAHDSVPDEGPPTED